KSNKCESHEMVENRQKGQESRTGQLMIAIYLVSSSFPANRSQLQQQHKMRMRRRKGEKMLCPRCTMLGGAALASGLSTSPVALIKQNCFLSFACDRMEITRGRLGVCG